MSAHFWTIFKCRLMDICLLSVGVSTPRLLLLIVHGPNKPLKRVSTKSVVIRWAVNKKWDSYIDIFLGTNYASYPESNLDGQVQKYEGGIWPVCANTAWCYFCNQKQSTDRMMDTSHTEQTRFRWHHKGEHWVSRRWRSVWISNRQSGFAEELQGWTGCCSEVIWSAVLMMKYFSWPGRNNDELKIALSTENVFDL